MTIIEEHPAGAEGAAGGEAKGLKSGAIGLLSTTVIAVSSTAPAYSLAAALGFIVIVKNMGFHAPGVMLLAFVPMLFIAIGYSRLNKEIPDCGTTFTWGAKTFGPVTGWLGGWAIFIADVYVMANLAQVAGAYMFNFFGAHNLESNTTWTTVAGVGWIVVMCAICYIGIEISTRIQYSLLVIEIVMLVIMSIVALVKVYAGTAPAADPADIKAHTFGAGPHHLALSWFNPFGAPFGALLTGLLTAVFIYWGWDTAVSVNEETRDREKTPGRAAVLATVILLVTYLLVSASAQAFSGIGANGIGLANSGNSSDVLSILGNSIFGGAGFGLVLAKLLVLMVLSSAMASTLTTILPTARTTLSMAVYKALPDHFARVHSRFLTPTWSTVGMGIISIILYVGMTIVNVNLLNDMIYAIGFPIAFYYALTGFECVWWYRRRLTDDWRTFFAAGLLPFAGGVMLTGMLVKACFYYWKPVNSFTSFLNVGGTFWTGVGGMVFGAILMLIWWRLRPAYFRGRVLNKDTPILTPEMDPAYLAAALQTGGVTGTTNQPNEEI